MYLSNIIPHSNDTFSSANEQTHFDSIKLNMASQVPPMFNVHAIDVQPLENLLSDLHSLNQTYSDTIKLNITSKVPPKARNEAFSNDPVVDSYRGVRFIRDLLEVNRTGKNNLSKPYPFKTSRIHLKAHTPVFRLSEKEIQAVLATIAAAQVDSNDELIKLTCFIQNQSVLALVDTGASSNYISRDTLTELDPLGLFSVEPHVQSIKVGDNRFVTSIGKVTLPMVVDQHGFATSFIILQNLSFEIILGMQFLSENNAIIDAADKSVYFNIMLPLNVNSIEQTTIPAYSCIALSAEAETPVDCTKIIKNVASFNHRYGAFVSHGTIRCDKNSLTVLVSNLTNTPIVIPEKTLIAQLHDAEEYEIVIHESLNGFFENDSSPKLNAESETISESAKASEIVDINSTDLDSTQLDQVKNLLDNYNNLFVSGTPGTTHLVTHEIDVEGNPPIHCPPYRRSPTERTIIQQEVDKMMKNKLIEPSRSPWSSPIVLIKKKDGSIRFCVDYRRLNLISKKDVYPLPRIDDSLAVLSGSMWYSTLDLTAGYHQVPLGENSKDKSAFITESGLYQWNVMAFGLTNAPATFQRLMDAVLTGLKWRTLLVYMDDICLFSKDFSTHLKRFKRCL